MTTEEVASYVVAQAVWAPSVHNTQPWRFTADGGPQLSLYADDGRQLSVTDPDGREMMISCGAALFNVRVALRSLGCLPATRVLPDPDQPALVAQVSWRPGVPADDFEQRLFGQLLTRRTHRGAFDPAPLPGGRWPPCARAPRGKGRRCASWPMTGAGPLSRPPCRPPSTSCATTANACANSPGGRLRPGAGAVTACRPPVTRRGPSAPTRTSPGGTSPAGTAGVCRRSAQPGHTGRPGWPGCSPRPPIGPADWVKAGQALQRIMLTASTYGAAVALHSQPLELPWLREFVRTELTDGAYPHLVLRMGLVTQVAVSVRRDPADVLFPAAGNARPH